MQTTRQRLFNPPSFQSCTCTPAPAAAQPIWKSQNNHLPLFKARMNPPTSNPPFVYRQYVCYCWLNRNLFGTPKDWVRLPDGELQLNFTWYIFWLLSFLFGVVTCQWSNALLLLLIHNIVWGMWNGWMKMQTSHRNLSPTYVFNPIFNPIFNPPFVYR